MPIDHKPTTTMTDVNHLASRLTVAPPVQWDTMVAKIDPKQNYDLGRTLDARAERAARLAAYFNARSLGQDHTKAVAASNRAAKAIRKVLGYAHPDSPINF